MLDADTTRSLAEIGFLGLSRGRTVEAARIFDALHAIRPADEVGAIGRALCLMAQGKPDLAASVLRDATQTPCVMAFACLALARNGDRAAAAEIDAEIAEIAPGSQAHEIARAALAA